MSQVYSTAELLTILANERKACMNGQRLSLAARPTGFSPMLDQFLCTDGIQKFTAYNDFRATIHQYQRDHQVSGIVWQTVTLRGHTLHYPQVDEHLIALPSDLKTLRAAKGSVFEFWQRGTVGMDLYLSLAGGKVHESMTLPAVDRIAQRTEWMTLCVQGSGAEMEVIVQMGWGQPEEATYRRGFPKSGSDCIHAVYPGRQPMS
jgi:hypothetical protein